MHEQFAAKSKLNILMNQLWSTEHKIIFQKMENTEHISAIMNYDKSFELVP